MESIYKKVTVNEEDDVPSDGEYDTNLGMIEVFCGAWVSDELPKWYLEEADLSPEEYAIDFGKYLRNNFYTNIGTPDKWIFDDGKVHEYLTTKQAHTKFKKETE